VKVPLNDCNGSAGMNTSKSLSLRENADTTKRASAPPADAMMKAKNVPLRGIADSTKPESAPPASVVNGWYTDYAAWKGQYYFAPKSALPLGPVNILP